MVGGTARSGVLPNQGDTRGAGRVSPRAVARPGPTEKLGPGATFIEPLEAALRDWNGRLSARGRVMLGGAAELEAYLRARGPTEA